MKNLEARLIERKLLMPIEDVVLRLKVKIDSKTIGQLS